MALKKITNKAQISRNRTALGSAPISVDEYNNLVDETNAELATLEGSIGNVENIVSGHTLEINSVTIDWYVDGTNGSDKNDGLTQATAFQTLTAAKAAFDSAGLGDYRIYVAPSTYTENIKIAFDNASAKLLRLYLAEGAIWNLSDNIGTVVEAVSDYTVYIEGNGDINFTGTGSFIDTAGILGGTAIEISCKNFYAEFQSVGQKIVNFGTDVTIQYLEFKISEGGSFTVSPTNSAGSYVFYSIQNTTGFNLIDAVTLTGPSTRNATIDFASASLMYAEDDNFAISRAVELNIRDFSEVLSNRAVATSYLYYQIQNDSSYLTIQRCGKVYGNIRSIEAWGFDFFNMETIKDFRGLCYVSDNPAMVFDCRGVYFNIAGDDGFTFDSPVYTIANGYTHFQNCYFDCEATTTTRVINELGGISGLYVHDSKVIIRANNTDFIHKSALSGVDVYMTNATHGGAGVDTTSEIINSVNASPAAFVNVISRYALPANITDSLSGYTKLAAGAVYYQPSSITSVDQLIRDSSF